MFFRSSIYFCSDLKLLQLLKQGIHFQLQLAARVAHFDHHQRIGHQELLYPRGCFNVWVRHQEGDNDTDLVGKGEKVD